MRPDLTSAAVPAALRAIVAKCLEQEPGRRYGDASALAVDLRRFLNGEPVHAAGDLFFGRYAPGPLAGQC